MTHHEAHSTKRDLNTHAIRGAKTRRRCAVRAIASEGMRVPLLLAVVALAWSGVGSAAGGPVAENPAFWLARDGKPAATIVVADKAIPSNQLAAEELRDHVELISGAALPIVSASEEVGGPVVLIGASRRTEKLDLQVPSGFSRELDEEGFVIKTLEDTLVLIGNDAGPVYRRKLLGLENTYKGSLFAVYELLERLGCRWYYPGDFGRVVPVSETISIAATDDKVKPSFPVRGFWYGSAQPRRSNDEFNQQMQKWMVRNRFLPYGSVLASAGDGSVMRPFREMRLVERDGRKQRVNILFENHPEYFAVDADGTRTSHYLCLSNPDVVDRATEYAIRHFEENPESQTFGYAPPDGVPTCECETCRKHNYNFMQKTPADPEVQDISEGFYRFLDQVADRVTERFPGKWITCTAYSGRIRPPEATEFGDSVSLHLAFLGYAQHHRLDFRGWQTQEKRTLLERWASINPYMVERQYYPAFQFHCNIPLPLHRAHAYNVRQLKDMGMAGAEWEGRAAFKTGLLNYYVMGRMLWDVDTDIDAVLREHYRLFYGAAAERVGRFVDEVEHMLTTAPVEYHEEERLREIYPYDDVARITDAVGDIEALVADADDRTKQRVRFARLVVDHFRAWAEMRHAETEFDYERAAGEARAMIEMEEELDAMNLTLLDSRSAWFDSRAVYGELGANASPHGKLDQYVTKQEMRDGTRGDLVADLPLQWEFSTDPENEGLIAQWYDPETTDPQQWTMLETTRPWETQGFQDEQLHGYDGYAWYRTTFTVPENFRGRRITLFIGGLNNQGWVWVNRNIAGHQPHHPFWKRWKYHHQVDISDHVRFGETNELTIRVLNDYNYGGLFRRSFVYSPKPDEKR